MSAALVMAVLAAASATGAVGGLCGELLDLLGRRRTPASGREETSEREATVLLRRFGRAFASAAVLRGLSPPRELADRLTAAGQPAGLGLREWLALKVVSAGVGALFAIATGAGSPSRIAILVIVAAPVAGFIGPDIWLARVARQRIEAAVRELPDMLDLLRVTVEAGMAPGRALGVVAAEFAGPLAREWRRASTEAALGLPEDQALASIALRLPADEVTAFVESLRRTRRHGVPLGRALAAQAQVARDRRRYRVREQAARAGPKIQLVVALLLVPAVLLVIAAALLAELERSGLLLPV